MTKPSSLVAEVRYWWTIQEEREWIYTKKEKAWLCCRDELSVLSWHLKNFLIYTVASPLENFILPSITESQSGWGRKWPLEIILSSPLAQAGPPRASCPGPCQDSFWIPSRMKTPPPLWAACTSTQSPSQGKRVSWCSQEAFCVSVCAHCLLTWIWICIALS